MAWSTAVVLGLSQATAGCRIFKPGSGVLAHQGIKIPGFESASTPTQKAVSGALAIGEDMISDLGTNLSNAGLALQEVDAVKAGAKKELVAQVSALIVSVEGSALRLAEDAAAPEAIALEIAGGSVVKGAVGQLGNINNAPAGSADIASARATLTGTIVSSSFNSIASATASIGGNATSAAAVAAVAEIMVGSAVASLNAAGLSGSNAAAGAKAVTAAAVASLANPTLSAGAPDTVAKAMMQSTVASLAKVDVPSTALQSVISEATSGAVGAMSKTGLDTTATISVVGAIAGGSVAGLKTVAANLSLSADAVASAVQGVTSGATSGLKVANIGSNALASAASNIAGESIKALGTAGFESSTVSASAGAVAAGAIAGLNSSGISAADLASNGVLKEVVKSTVANLGKTALDSSAISSTVGLVVGNAVAGLSGASSADTAAKQSLVADVVKGAVSGAAGAGVSGTSAAATTLNSITQSATSSLVKAGFTAAEVASTSSSVAGAAVSAAVTSGAISSENLVTLTVQINSGVATALGTLSKEGVLSESQLTAATSQVAQSIITSATSNAGGTQFTVDSSLASTLATATSNALTGAGVDQTTAQNVATSVTNAASNTIANIALPTPPTPPTVAPGAAVCFQSYPEYRWNIGFPQPYTIKLLQAIYSSDGIESTPESCVANDPLPTGLSVNSKCEISGTPTNMSFQKSFGFIATLANGASCNFAALLSVMPYISTDPTTDHTKPQITAIEFMNNDFIVDSSSNNKPDREVSVKITGADNTNLANEYGVYITFTHVSTARKIRGETSHLHDLDPVTNSYTFPVEFPLGSFDGDWRIESITIQDEHGNASTVLENDVSAALRTSFTQVIANIAPPASVDSSPPVVTMGWAAGIAIPTVNSALPDEPARDVFPQITVTDSSFPAEIMKISWIPENDVTGAYQIHREYFLSSYRINPVYFNTDSVGGDYEYEPLLFPYGAPGGRWKVSAIDVEDTLGNRGKFRLNPGPGEIAIDTSIAALRIDNIATTFDLSAPSLTNMVVANNTIDAGYRDAMVQVTLNISDDLGWLGPPAGDSVPVSAPAVQEIAFRHPSGMLISMSDIPDPTMISQTTTTLTVVLDLPLLQGIPTGVYTFDKLRIVDGAGRTRLYKGTSELLTAAPTAPTTITVLRTLRNSDNDAILDEYDSCPTYTAPAGSVDGCNPDDPDMDNIIGNNDACPNEPGPASYSGCPAGFFAFDPNFLNSWPSSCSPSLNPNAKVWWESYNYNVGMNLGGPGNTATPLFTGNCEQINTGPIPYSGASYVWRFVTRINIWTANNYKLRLDGNFEEVQIFVNDTTTPIASCSACSNPTITTNTIPLSAGIHNVEIRVRRGGGPTDGYSLYIGEEDPMAPGTFNFMATPATATDFAHHKLDFQSATAFFDDCGSDKSIIRISYTIKNNTFLPARVAGIANLSATNASFSNDYCSTVTLDPGQSCSFTGEHTAPPGNLVGSNDTVMMINMMALPPNVPIEFQTKNIDSSTPGVPPNRCP